MARMAVEWAPGDPLDPLATGLVQQEKTFTAENLARAVREYELAVQASPYDYRYWMELGRALEASGDPDAGEKALLRAVELAPAYSHPRWHYGNLLLRQGKLDQAFAQLARAAEADEVMQPQIFALASQVFGGDVDKIARLFRRRQCECNSPSTWSMPASSTTPCECCAQSVAGGRKAQSALGEQALTRRSSRRNSFTRRSYSCAN